MTGAVANEGRMAQSFGGAPRSRRPWYWLVVLFVGVALGSSLVYANARVRIDQNRRQFETAESLRLQGISGDVGRLFRASAQMVGLGAQVLTHITGNKGAVERFTYDLYITRPDPRIYGVGQFFIANTFPGATGYISVYDRRVDPHLTMRPIDHRLTRDVVEVEDETPGRDVSRAPYESASWFQDALAARGTIGIDGPYDDHGREFLSILKAVRFHGRWVGVVSADTLESDFIAILRAHLAPGDVAWVKSNLEGVRMKTGPLPSAQGHHAIRVHLPYSLRSELWLSATTAALDVSNREIIVSSALMVVAMWCLAGLVAAGLLQRWRAHEAQDRLEVERRRLESEIALGKIVETELRKAAFTDALTGLPNRPAFIEFVREIIEDPKGRSYAVFFIDLDRFNIVNETLGHLAGDDLLRAIGARMRVPLEDHDLVARLGGDEFVLVASIESRSFAEAAGLFLAHLAQPVVIQGRPIHPEASMGVVALDDSYATPEELLRDADIAMYEAKRRGRGRFVIFDAEMRRRVAEESQLEESLRRAVERGELVPYYQPIVNVVTRRIVAFEALVRWLHADGTVTKASEFMHFAEQRGYVQAIDTLVLREVCRHAKAIFDVFPSATIGVNFSAAEFTSGGLREMVEPMLAESGVPANRITVEITETAMMTSSEFARRSMDQLRELGVTMVLDDFGTGYSSLAYLQRLPITGLKIDRAFVQPLLEDPKAVEIVRSIVMLAASFGLATTAEGVETLEHFEILSQLGVEKAQGFFFSPAVDISTLIRLGDQTVSTTPRAAVE
jgi:diguanylate cyclase (GGDEF)-like protein